MKKLPAQWEIFALPFPAARLSQTIASWKMLEARNQKTQ
jgi:hypothetical protein